MSFPIKLNPQVFLTIIVVTMIVMYLGLMFAYEVSSSSETKQVTTLILMILVPVSLLVLCICTDIHKGGLLFVFISVIGIAILIQDYNNAKLFEHEGIKTKATVSNLSYLITGTSKSSWMYTQPIPIAFDFVYKVGGKEYDHHTLRNYQQDKEVHKGDIIDIEYASSNPAVSRYLVDSRTSGAIKSIMQILAGVFIAGIALIFWPVKKQEIQKTDWSEYERTHE